MMYVVVQLTRGATPVNPEQTTSRLPPACGHAADVDPAVTGTNSRHVIKWKGRLPDEAT
jgi:hypothetical protein